ncbi:activator-dependent family glycosyltransferase [Sinosporangium siamense]|uniref:Glycosyl transferase n=1 Tax=Sinosporangium siamense TaxID=1367973 RepID=A0A919RF19_9ACTN|nr:activator-dependent family glycosyltransferase [Sinosporangium siamense]GII90686.1 glycosyl transferase [Sinosporangium siamense]
MRVLFTAYAEKAHFLGMVPLAWAMQNAGHEVRVASQPELTDVITRAGLIAVPVGKDHILHKLDHGHDPGADFDFDFAETREEKLTWDYVKSGYGDLFVPWWARVVNDPMIGQLTEFAQQWKPDLVIWEPVTFAGAIAAKVCGAAHARFLWSIDLFAMMRARYMQFVNEKQDVRQDALRRWIDNRAERFGASFSEDMASGHFTIDCLPPSVRLRFDVDVKYQSMRYVPYNGVAELPRWLREDPERPRVAITLGTSATERVGNLPISVQNVLDAVADLDIEVVATLPEEEQAKLTAVPDNTRLVPFVPLDALAPTCSAVINHGGGGTFMTTLVRGVPQLILPFMFDDAMRARRLAAAGAGMSMEKGDVSTDTVRTKLLALLEQPSYKENAAKLRDEAMSMPSPSDFVPELERLTAEHRDAAVSGA